MWSIFSIFLLTSLVSCSPRHRHRQYSQALDVAPIFGKFDSVSAGQYSLLNNLWGEQDASGGSQFTQLLSLNGTTIAWKTTWTWTGGSQSQVKSYANAQLDVGINKQLSAISSMPSIWQWSATYGSSTLADVAYDLFTAYYPGGSNVNEIMIWLGNFNSGPISKQYDQWGHAVPITTGISIGDHTWDLYSGSNGVNWVYSFLLTSGNVNSYSGDIFEFFTYLINNEGLGTDQYLITAQAGTEAFYGGGTLTTSAYSLSIN